MDEKIKSAIDKLFEDAKKGNDKAGRILCQIFNETLQATMRCQLYPRTDIIKFTHKIGKRVNSTNF